ncbi:MAG: 50S ribosomal protein L15 [Candidatus Kerfeldbacteria bacterium]|nr:50S ribosomal protein L15 [Candidatus Kerfeldbacteria bacterium]
MPHLSLHSISPNPKARKNRRRVGRGNGSRGTTAGRGTKGQRSRTGGTRGIIRRSMRSLMERVAKQRGFTSRHAKYTPVNLMDLERVFSNQDVVTPATLQAKQLVTHIGDGVKVLGSGKLSKSLTVRVHAVSATAKAAIEQAGGQVVLLGQRPASPGKKEN